MRYWWVNQNQTFEQEFHGGYMWSPKRNANGARNPFYENMREVAPGDIIFSFRDTEVAAIGIAQSYGYECPKPAEFEDRGAYWEMIGWRVDVAYTVPPRRIRPKDHMTVLAPLLAEKYAPLQANGRGKQGVYLTDISDRLAVVLAGLIGGGVREMVTAPVIAGPSPASPPTMKGIDEWEDHLQRKIESDTTIPETERKALIRARRGQGAFKRNVMDIEHACRITKVENPVHLIGSHIKPWRDATNEERLDGENGLLLTPSIDHLFDRGIISFQDDGELLVSPRADQVSLQRMGVRVGEQVNVGGFTQGQTGFLEFHRDCVFLKAKRLSC